MMNLLKPRVTVAAKVLISGTAVMWLLKWYHNTICITVKFLYCH